MNLAPKVADRRMVLETRPAPITTNDIRDILTVVAPVIDPIEIVTRNSTLERIQDLVLGEKSVLDDHEKMLIRMYYWEEHTLESMGKALGRTREHVRAEKNRAMSKLHCKGKTMKELAKLQQELGGHLPWWYKRSFLT